MGPGDSVTRRPTTTTRDEPDLFPSPAGTIVAAVIGFAGAVLIARAGSVLGDRAAAAVPEPERVGCGGGCACGSGGCAPQPAEESATA